MFRSSFHASWREVLRQHAPAFYARTTYSVLKEARVLDWLAGRLNVPEVVCVTAGAGGEWMITRGVPGEPVAARIEAGRPVVELFREALQEVVSAV